MDKKLKSPRIIPHNIEAEQSVLGCNLIDDNAVLQIMNILKVEDFYTEAHKTIFEAMCEIYHNNKPIDYVTLTDQLEKWGSLEAVGGIDYITTLTNAVPSAVNYRYYCDIIRRDSTLRKLIKVSQEIIDKAYSASDDVLDFAERSIFEISQKEDFSSLVHIKDVLPDVISKLEKLEQEGGSVRGIPTGFSELDKITNGLQRSDLILLAARPSVGKTSLAMNIVSNAALLGKHVIAVFSLEMPKEQIALRTLCSVSGVNMEKALGGKLSTGNNGDNWKAIWGGNLKLGNTQIFIDDSSLNTPVDILSKCRRLKREQGGLDLIMIDYLQLMGSSSLSEGRQLGNSVKSENRQQQISEITRNLKIAARELQVPIILLSQLSRDIEKREGHKPVLSDLRESGAIEQDADIVMFIHNPSKYGDETNDAPNICELIIAKHRNGSLGTIKLKWIPEITTFVDVGKSSNISSLEETAPPPPPPPEYSNENVMTETDDIDF